MMIKDDLRLFACLNGVLVWYPLDIRHIPFLAVLMATDFFHPEFNVSNIWYHHRTFVKWYMFFKFSLHLQCSTCFVQCYIWNKEYQICIKVWLNCITVFKFCLKNNNWVTFHDTFCVIIINKLFNSHNPARTCFSFTWRRNVQCNQCKCTM